MNTHRLTRAAAMIALLSAVACDDTADIVDFDDLTPEEQIELSVLEDQGAWEIAVDVASVSADAAEPREPGSAAAARVHNAQARTAFEDARRAWLNGDHRRALDAGRVARRLVARALIATGGVPAVEDLLERLEDVLLTIDDEVVDDPDALRAELETIIAEAEALLEAGDSVGAAALGILGEQRLRLRRGRHLRDFRVSEERARLEVGLAASAVALAERLLAEDAVSDDDVLTDTDPATDVANNRNRWLAHANRWLDRAETALSNGFYARAVHAAHHAQWSALKAVVLPGGITAAEVLALLELSEDLYAEADASLGDDATELQLRVLARAGELLEIGKARLDAGRLRGIAALWRSAMMSHWLID